MRYDFKRLNLTKQTFLDFFREKKAGDFLTLENAHLLFADFFKRNQIRLIERDSWVLFLNFDKTQQQTFNIEQMAHVVFEEKEGDFFDRQIGRHQFISPQINSEPKIQPTVSLITPAIIQKLASNQFYQRKNHFEFFKKLDFDKKGKISHDDLKKFARENLSPKITDFELKEFIGHLDPLNSGQLSFKELYQRLYPNVENSHLQENSHQTNILQSKQFNSQKYLNNFPSVTKTIKEVRESFCVRAASENRWISRLLHERQV